MNIDLVGDVATDLRFRLRALELLLRDDFDSFRFAIQAICRFIDARKATFAEEFTSMQYSILISLDLYGWLSVKFSQFALVILELGSFRCLGRSGRRRRRSGSVRGCDSV